MLWEEDSDQEVPPVVPDDVVDVSFKIECRDLPLDHAHALSSALCAALPWLEHEEAAGVHLIHGAESGNGWIRPEGPQDLIYFSRRTRLYLRLPRERVAQAQALAGTSLDVLGRDIRLSAPGLRPLSLLTTLFARHLNLPGCTEDEARFLNEAHGLLQAQGIRVKKMLSGRAHRFSLPAGEVLTRSLLLDGLTVDNSLKLQRAGLGPGRKQGFGIFLPHKGIDAVPAADKK